MKKTKTAGMTDTGDEARERFHLMISTREETRAETDSLFANAKASRARDRSVVAKHFKQAPAVVTMAPNLQAEPPKEDLSDSNDPNTITGQMSGGSLLKSASVAPNVDAWFEKNSSAFLTEAQRRYPELLKVAGNEQGKLPTAVKRPQTASPSGPVPVRAQISGGSA